LIDTIAPAIPVISASNDNFGLYQGDIASGTPTNDTTPLMSGTAEPNSLVSMFDAGVLIGTVTATAGGTWSFMPTLVGEGTHAITVTATDAAGNPSFSSAIWTVEIDTIPPLKPVIAASNDGVGIYQGDLASGTPTNDPTPLMSGTAEPNSLVSLYDGGVLAGSVRADASGHWAIIPTLVGDGAHPMTITATDAAGNISFSSNIWTVQLDTTAPAFSSNPNTSVNENTGAGSVIYTAATSDASNVTYALTGGPDAGLFSINSITGQVTLNFRPDYEAPADSGRNNVYNYTITATDAAGNQTTQDAALTVLDVPERPTLVVTQGASGFWVMASPGSLGSVRNHFIIGKLSSDMPVSYSTDKSIIKVAADGTIYTESSDLASDNSSIFARAWIGAFGSAMAYTPYTFHVTATSASGEVTVLTGVVQIYNGNGSPAGYPGYDNHYTSSYTPPVALDLNHDGHITYTDTGVDVGGNGQTHTSAWVGKEDGVLVWDKYHDGKVHDSSQYAFAQYLAGAKTDLEGLKAFDTNGNGKIDGGDTIWNEMRVWQDLNGNGVSDAGEIKTLDDWGITSIDLKSDGAANVPINGVYEAGKGSATLKDGSQMVLTDVSFDTLTTVQGNVVAHPFILDLNRDGEISYGKDLIDANGTGARAFTAWAGREDGVMIWDKYQDGQLHDSSQYSFGSLTGADAAMQGLKIFDTNADGKLDNHDALWNELGVWQINADGVGSMKTLTQLGIQSISLVSDGISGAPADGVTEAGRTTASMTNGETMVVADATVSHVSIDTPAPPPPLSYLDQNQHVVI